MTEPTPEPRTDPVSYRVTCLPPDAHPDDLVVYSITVHCRGQLADLPPGRCWSVDRYDSAQLDRSGQWSWPPPGWDPDWLAEHRFDRDTAFDRARAAARDLARLLWKEGG